MPAQRKPSKVLEITGAYAKNPQRRNDAEPEGNGAFPELPPDHLDELEKTYWREIVDMVPAGVLTGSDTLAVEILTKLLTQFRTDYGRFTTSKLSRMSLEMGRLGLSPSDRTKLEIEKPKGNKFAE